jgi:predicted site-specific integrase-resolvase
VKREIFDRVFSPQQAVAFSRVSRAVLRRWEREGRVRQLRTAIGGHRRYLESELVAAMVGRRGPRVSNQPLERHGSAVGRP